MLSLSWINLYPVRDGGCACTCEALCDVSPKVDVVENVAHGNPPPVVHVGDRPTPEEDMPQPRLTNLIWIERTVLRSLRTEMVAVVVKESAPSNRMWSPKADMNAKLLRVLHKLGNLVLQILHVGDFV